MRLPSMKYSDGIRKSTQVRFGGLNMTEGAGDGELRSMKNLTSDHYPLLASRKPRWMYSSEIKGQMFVYGRLFYVHDGEFYDNGRATGIQLLDYGNRFVGIGKKIVIMPAAVYYDTESRTYGNMELSITENAEFRSQSYDGIEGIANCMVVRVDPFDFKAGDAVTISGCVQYPENNKTAVIRDVVKDPDGVYVYFDDDCFVLAEEGRTNEKVTISRGIPRLLYMCQCNNRVWGCDENTIYASKLGDIFNWNVFDGTEDDAWQWTHNTPGAFTGCICYNDHPIFFKENEMYIIYGSVPSEFQTVKETTIGVSQGGADSLAIASDTLFYLSTVGIMAYRGGAPQCISGVFGDAMISYCTAACSDGKKYYSSLAFEERRELDGLYVYDTGTGMWHREDDRGVDYLACQERRVFMTSYDAMRACITGESPFTLDWDLEQEEDMPWEAEFTDFTDNNPNKKGVSKLQIRLELAEGATFKAEIMYNSDGSWHTVKQLVGEGKKRSYYLPITPRRADHYRLRLSGTGECKVHSLSREYYVGSEYKSRA